MVQVKIDSNIVFQLWANKEKAMGEPLKVSEAAEITKLTPETIRKIREGKITWFDAHVIAKLCQLLDVPPGPVPFIIYEVESAWAVEDSTSPNEAPAISDLGHKLKAIRERAIAAGMTTLSEEEIVQEIADRRGERL
jgi:DNA-binding Xre family transcriptional regulator